jgi:hypothetical protein
MALIIRLNIAAGLGKSKSAGRMDPSERLVPMMPAPIARPSSNQTLALSCGAATEKTEHRVGQNDFDGRQENFRDFTKNHTNPPNRQESTESNSTNHLAVLLVQPAPREPLCINISHPSFPLQIRSFLKRSGHDVICLSAQATVQ